MLTRMMLQMAGWSHGSQARRSGCSRQEDARTPTRTTLPPPFVAAGPPWQRELRLGDSGCRRGRHGKGRCLLVACVRGSCQRFAMMRPGPVVRAGCDRSLPPDRFTHVRVRAREGEVVDELVGGLDVIRCGSVVGGSARVCRLLAPVASQRACKARLHACQFVENTLHRLHGILVCYQMLATDRGNRREREGRGGLGKKNRRSGRDEGNCYKFSVGRCFTLS
jgi:hypothetical protein